MSKPVILTKQQKEIMKGRICPYCSRPSIHINSSVVYGIDYGMIYYCQECKAWVGCHKGDQSIALGRLANQELREAKKIAHKWFDRLWNGGPLNRNQAYEMLSEELNLPKEYTHIGMFSVDTCKKVVEFSQRILQI